MALKSPLKAKDRKRGRENMKDEQNGFSATAALAQTVRRISLTHGNSDSGQASFEEDNDAIEHDEETSIKSCVANKVLDAAPPLTHDLLDNKESDFDRKQAQPKSAVGALSRQIVQTAINLPGNMQQDVALNSSKARMHAAQSDFVSVSIPSISVAENYTYRTSTLSSTSASSAERAAHALPLEMNILPSLPEPRIKNTDIPAGFAEQQPSFRTTSTVSSDLSPINGDTISQQQVVPQISQSVCQSNFIPSLGMYSLPRAMYFASPCISTEDNVLGQPQVTARPVNGYAWQNNGSSYSRSSAGAAGNGRQLSHSSSTSSLRSFISDECLVKKMSWRILRHVAQTLQCKSSSISWKDLVERYGWDYERTYLFENRPHQEFIFFSLLLEPEFQDYSLEQLRQDLFELPRRDILNDMNKMIIEHNASASLGATGQNQFN